METMLKQRRNMVLTELCENRNLLTLYESGEYKRSRTLVEMKDFYEPILSERVETLENTLVEIERQISIEHGSFDWQGLLDGAEIIGNIHDNPELL